MKKSFLFVLLCAVAQWVWSQNPTIVTTDAEIRSAVQVNNANIQLGGDIDLSNKTLEIPKNNTVTMDLNGHKLDRKLTQRGQGGGQVITVRQGATLNLSNGTFGKKFVLKTLEKLSFFPRFKSALQFKEESEKLKLMYERKSNKNASF